MRYCAIVLCLLAVYCEPASADILEHYIYESSVLPSQIGWRLTENSDESLVCWLQDGILHLNTMGQPDYDPYSVAGYHRAFHVNEVEPETITVRFRTRVLELEASGNWRTGFALLVDWTNPDGSGDLFGFAIAPHHLFRWLNGHSFADLDATQWHDYTMICDLIHGQMTVLVDDATIGTYAVDPGQGARRVYFGDFMLNSNANAEIAELEYTIEGSPNVSVAAATWSAVKDLFRN